MREHRLIAFALAASLAAHAGLLALLAIGPTAPHPRSEPAAGAPPARVVLVQPGAPAIDPRRIEPAPPERPELPGLPPIEAASTAATVAAEATASLATARVPADIAPPEEPTPSAGTDVAGTDEADAGMVALPFAPVAEPPMLRGFSRRFGAPSFALPPPPDPRYHAALAREHIERRLAQCRARGDADPGCAHALASDGAPSSARTADRAAD